VPTYIDEFGMGAYIEVRRRDGPYSSLSTSPVMHAFGFGVVFIEAGMGDSMGEVSDDVVGAYAYYLVRRGTYGLMARYVLAPDTSFGASPAGLQLLLWSAGE
jgi:hypothetical protein